MHHFLIYPNYKKDIDLVMTSKIKAYLEGKGQKCSIYSEIQEYEERKIFSLRAKVSEDVVNSIICEIPSDTYCMIVLGGDGTVLQAAREVKDANIPMIGVNLGTLGYLAEVEMCNLENSLDMLIDGHFDVESRMMVHGKIFSEEGRELSEDYALNDIVVSRGGSLQVIKFKVYVNGQLLKEYCADGVIITTPTGSTGYNLSAGGPIVKPGARVLMLTPISPHTLINRSIILSPEDVIEVEIPVGRDGNEQCVNAYFDGAHLRTLKTGERVRICAAERRTNIISLNHISFLEVLRRKMKETDEAL